MNEVNFHQILHELRHFETTNTQRNIPQIILHAIESIRRNQNTEICHEIIETCFSIYQQLLIESIDQQERITAVKKDMVQAIRGIHPHRMLLRYKTQGIVLDIICRLLQDPPQEPWIEGIQIAQELVQFTPTKGIMLSPLLDTVLVISSIEMARQLVNVILSAVPYDSSMLQIYSCFEFVYTIEEWCRKSKAGELNAADLERLHHLLLELDGVFMDSITSPEAEWRQGLYLCFISVMMKSNLIMGHHFYDQFCRIAKKRLLMVKVPIQQDLDNVRIAHSVASWFMRGLLEPKDGTFDVVSWFNLYKLFFCITVDAPLQLRNSNMAFTDWHLKSPAFSISPSLLRYLTLQLTSIKSGEILTEIVEFMQIKEMKMFFELVQAPTVAGENLIDLTHCFQTVYVACTLILDTLFRSFNASKSDISLSVKLKVMDVLAYLDLFAVNFEASGFVESTTKSWIGASLYYHQDEIVWFLVDKMMELEHFALNPIVARRQYRLLTWVDNLLPVLAPIPAEDSRWDKVFSLLLSILPSPDPTLRDCVHSIFRRMLLFQKSRLLAQHEKVNPPSAFQLIPSILEVLLNSYYEVITIREIADTIGFILGNLPNNTLGEILTTSIAEALAKRTFDLASQSPNLEIPELYDAVEQLALLLFLLLKLVPVETLPTVAEVIKSHFLNWKRDTGGNDAAFDRWLHETISYNCGAERRPWLVKWYLSIQQ